MPDGQLVGSPLVAGIHGLGGPQKRGHLGLGQVVVLPHAANLFLQSPHGFTSDQKNILSVAKYRILLADLVKNFTEKDHKQLDADGDLSYHAGIHLCIDNCTNNGVTSDGMHVRLAYPDSSNMPTPAPAFIVVGGATLSRGLTIEGLISTGMVMTVTNSSVEPTVIDETVVEETTEGEIKENIEEQAEVVGEAEEIDYELIVVGDINEDGRANIVEVVQIINHIVELEGQEIEGTRLKRIQKLTGESQFVNKVVRDWLQNTTPKQRENFVNIIYDVLISTEAKEFNKLKLSNQCPIDDAPIILELWKYPPNIISNNSCSCCLFLCAV